MFPAGVVGKTKHRPYVTIGIIVVNIVMFIVQLVMASRGQLHIAFGEWGYNPCLIGQQPFYETVLDAFRSMFLHGGWAHLFGNMWFLLLFGSRVEEYFGRGKYLIFYLAAGIGATMAFHIARGGVCGPAIGASGAISGVMGAFWLLYPGVRVNTFVPLLWRTFKLKSMYMLGFWFGMQLLYGILSLGPTGAIFGPVAYWAHIGGFVAGILIVFISMNFKPLPKVDPFAYMDEDD